MRETILAGLLLGSLLAPETVLAAAPIEWRHAKGRNGELKTLVVLVKYKDSPAQTVTVEQVREGFFGSGLNSMGRLMDEFSYGRLKWSGSVIGWYTLPINMPTADVCQDSVIAEAEAMLRSRGLETDSYDRIYFVSPGPCNTDGGNWWPKLDRQKSVIPVSIFPIPSLGYWAHEEFGHRTGLHHANGLDCGAVSIRTDLAACSIREYQSPVDLMGGGPGHFNSRFKEFQEWLEVPVATGPGTFTLTPLSMPGTRALKIAVPQGVYYVDFRAPLGHDAGANLTGVFVHFVYNQASMNGKGSLPPANGYPNPFLSNVYTLDMTPQTRGVGGFLDGALAAGMTFRGPFTGFELTATSVGSVSAQVSLRAVSFVDNTAPQLSFGWSEGQTIARVDNQPIPLNVTDNVVVSKILYYIDGAFHFQREFDSNWQADSSNFQVPWAVGQAAPGPHRLRALAYDLAGNSASAEVTVNVPPNAPPTLSWITPAPGVAVSGRVRVIIAARDDRSPETFSRAELYADGRLVHATTNYTLAYPQYRFEMEWDAFGLSGIHELTARVYDGEGAASSLTLSVSVAADTQPPAVSLQLGSTGTVSGRLSATARAFDNLQIERIELLVDGALWATTRSTSCAQQVPPPIYPNMCAAQILTPRFGNGSHTITARAYDAAGLLQSSSALVDFWNPPDFKPLGRITYPANGAVYSSYGPQGAARYGINLQAWVSDPTEIVSEYSWWLDGVMVSTGSADASSGFSINGETQIGTYLIGKHGIHKISLNTVNPFGRSSSTAVFVALRELATDPWPGFPVSPQTYAPALGSTIAVPAPWIADVPQPWNTAAVQFLLDGIPFGAEDSTFPFSTTIGPSDASKGPHFLAISARSNSGQVVLGPARRVYFDNPTQRPSAAINAPAPGASVSGSVSVALSGADAYGIRALELYVAGQRVGAITGASGTVAWNSTTVSNGPIELVAKAYDLFNNTATKTLSVSVANVDASSPAVNWVAGVIGSTYTGRSARVQATASDNIRVARAEFLLDGAALGPGSSFVANYYELYWDSTRFAVGPHTLTFRAYDNVGNSSSRSGTIYVGAPDLVAPSLSIDSPAAGATVSSGALVSLTASDARGVASVRVYLDGTLHCLLSASPYRCVLGAATSASHTLMATAADAAGNVSTVTRSIQIVNPGDPSTRVVAPVAGSTVTGTVSVSLTASDPDGISLLAAELDGQPLRISQSAPLSFAWDTTQASIGTHWLTARASDGRSNTTLHTIPLTVARSTGPLDATPPLLSAIGASFVNSSSATVNWTSDEPADGQVDFGTTTLYGRNSPLITELGTAHSVLLVSLDAGTTYHYRVRSRDASGNLTVSQDHTLLTRSTADTTPPQVHLTAPLNGSKVGGTVTVIGTAVDAAGVAGVQFKLDGVALGSEDGSAPYSISWNTSLYSDGAHVVTAIARDAAGNSAVAASTVTVDNSAPQFSGIAAAVAGPSSATISWTSNEPADTQVEYGTSTVYGRLSPLQPALIQTHAVLVTGLEPGTLYHYRVRSRDTLGHLGVSSDNAFTTGASSGTTEPTVDSTAPLISSITVSEIGTSSATIRWTTDEPADTQLEYGTTLAYGTLASADKAYGTSHIALISGLAPGTVYHCRARSRDMAGNLAVSPDFTLTPKSPAGNVDSSSPTAPGQPALWAPSYTELQAAWAASTDTVSVAGYRLDVALNAAFTSWTKFYRNRDLGKTTSYRISGLKRNTRYYVRVRAYDAAGNLSSNSPSANALTSPVAAPDGGGKTALATLDEPQQSAIVSASFTQAQLAIPAGALADAAEISIEVLDSPQVQALSYGGLVLAGPVHRFGPQELAFQKPATLSLPYVGELAPALYRLDPASGAWLPVEQASADPGRHMVSAPISELGTYAPLIDPTAAPLDALEIRQLRAYPNPARPGQKPVIHVDVGGIVERVELTVSNMAGELVDKMTLESPRLKGGTYVYEQAWSAANAPSGVYILSAKALKNGQASSQKKARFALIK